MNRVSVEGEFGGSIEREGLQNGTKKFLGMMFIFIILTVVMVSWVYGGGGLVAKSWPTLLTPYTVAHQAPLSMEFSRQE